MLVTIMAMILAPAIIRKAMAAHLSRIERSPSLLSRLEGHGHGLERNSVQHAPDDAELHFMIITSPECPAAGIMAFAMEITKSLFLFDQVTLLRENNG
jgi:hypothetical protein